MSAATKPNRKSASFPGCCSNSNGKTRSSEHHINLRVVSAAFPTRTMEKKGSEKNRHVVPWLTKAEMDQVRDYLYSMDSSLQGVALDRISAWRTRCTDSFPVAMDCTADLVRCQMRDLSGQLTGDDLIMMYGTALVRFVNLITERQLKPLAGNLSIPEWMVDLRNEIMHGKLPSLKWCQRGCKVALEWLQQEFWSRQLGGAPDERCDLQSHGEDEDVKRQEDELVARQKEVDVCRKARELLISYEKDQHQLILDDMEHPTPQETREKLVQPCSIYTQTECSEASTPLQQQQQQPIYTVEMPLDEMQHSQQDARPLHSLPMDSETSEERKWADLLAERALALRGSPWQVCTDNVSWKNYPIGKVPGQSDDPSCLMVDNYTIMTVSDQPVELESSATRSSIPGASAPVRPAEGHR
ncbi:unnamed protein product [Oreochromis niloticus]|nr:unnamed protein product [Mustela putorius furo]